MSLKQGAAAMVAIAAALGLAAGADLRAQAAPPIDLAAVKALKCSFSVATRAAWKNGEPEPTIRRTGLLTVEIRQVDAVNGSGMAGTVSTGSHDVTVQLDGRTLHFIEASRGGRIAVTTVFAEYSTGTKLKAVHTRTDYLPIDLPGFRSEPEISQYYGDCENAPAPAR